MNVFLITLLLCLGHEDIVDLLLAFGAEIDCTNNSGCTPLHLACKRDFPKTVVSIL